MRVTIRISEKDTTIRRWLELVHESGAAASDYVSIAIRYYLKYKKPLNLGMVRQAVYTNAISTSFLIPDYLAEELDGLALKFGNYKRSRLIKTILSKCITLKKGYEPEAMADLYELMDVMIHMDDEEPTTAAKQSESVAVQEEVPVAVAEKDVVKIEPERPKTEEKKAAKKEEGSKKPENKLLGGLFPDFQDQIDDWE